MPVQRLLAIVAVALTASLGLAGPALAESDPYAPAPGEATASATTVTQGGTVTVSGKCFKPGTPVTVTVRQGGRLLQRHQINANSAGKASITLTLTKVGTNTVRLFGKRSAACGGGTQVLGVKIQVRPAAASNAKGKELGATGADLTPLWGGLALLVAGGTLVAVGRKRRGALV